MDFIFIWCLDELYRCCSYVFFAQTLQWEETDYYQDHVSLPLFGSLSLWKSEKLWTLVHVWYSASTFDRFSRSFQMNEQSFRYENIDDRLFSHSQAFYRYPVLPTNSCGRVGVSKRHCQSISQFSTELNWIPMSAEVSLCILEKMQKFHSDSILVLVRLGT